MPQPSPCTTPEIAMQAVSGTSEIGQQPHRRVAILFLVDQFTELGGGERVLLEIAQGLPSTDFQAYVVALRHDPDPCIWDLPCNIRILHMRKTYGWAALRTALQLRRLIRELSIDIVHTFFETSDIFGLLVAKLSGVKAVVSSRRDMGILRTPKHNIAYRLLSRYFSAVITVSEQVRQRVIALDRIKPSSVITIHNGVRENYLSRDPMFSLPAGLPPGARVVSTIANVQSWKGIDVFIRCAAEVHRIAPDVRFIVAGKFSDAGLAAQLRAMVTELQMDDCFHFLGPIHDVRGLLHSSDVFCLLSRSEGFPNVVLEAMSCGAPVVATRVGGTPEAVDDGVSGWLVESEDHRAAAERVLLLLKDGAMHTRMAEAAMKRVRTRFTREAMLANHVAVYQRVLRSRQSQPISAQMIYTR